VQLTGRSILGMQLGEASGKTLRAINPATGEQMEPVFFAASPEEVDRAGRLAASAFVSYSRLNGKAKAKFLRKIAELIEAFGDEFVSRAVQETALAAARIKSETARTVFQLRLFAEMIAEGSWVNARIDRADANRAPLPKPDVRSLSRPIGPVAVFCASNFPIAFSVAGGDTASALAAGNPVIVKAHAAHLGTAEMVGQAVRDAARECGMPDGVFSLLFGAGTSVGTALVNHPAIKAVGFTGSRSGGRALMQQAAARPEPIPVYAEMSSVNPVFILPGAMKERRADIAKGLHASVTLGAGQFCTKPGVVILQDDARAREFASELSGLMKSTSEFTLLSSQIQGSYREGVETRARQNQVESVAVLAADPQKAGFHVGPSLFETDATAFLKNEKLAAEIFGPSTLLVRHSSREQLLELARNLEGHLTATLHGTEADLREYADLIAILETKVGRVIFNGYPTGVEVCHAMVHGGPFPATSDGRSTSVGTQAIYRFTRLICYQNFPDAALPEELQNDNPLGIWRLVDGRMSREPLASKAQAKFS
jgi:alpha-ketoglutaric semialdehyde dehydrogenase